MAEIFVGEENLEISSDQQKGKVDSPIHYLNLGTKSIIPTLLLLDLFVPLWLLSLYVDNPILIITYFINAGSNLLTELHEACGQILNLASLLKLEACAIWSLPFFLKFIIESIEIGILIIETDAHRLESVFQPERFFAILSIGLFGLNH